MAETRPAGAESLPSYLACPHCRASLRAEDQELVCEACGARYGRQQGVPLLFAQSGSADDVARVQAHYDDVATEYDQVFASHVTRHYLDKRLAIVERFVPRGRVLDVGCGTGALGGYIARAGYDVVGVDISPGMLARAVERGLSGAFAAYASALPFADNSFDLALTVATLHHLESPVRVAFTIREMGRVIRAGGHILLWDHNPLNPYWPILMKRVPQDTGDERLVPLRELLADVADAGLEVVFARRLGLIPDFVPVRLMPLARFGERVVEELKPLSWLAAHNVVVARKP